MANNQYFAQIADGRYGRKVAYTDIFDVQRSDVLELLGATIGIFAQNKEAINYLWNYYKGDQPVLYRTKINRSDINNKIVENRAYELVQHYVAQTYGEPIMCVARKDKQHMHEAVDMLNEFSKNANKPARDIVIGEWQNAVGFAYVGVIADAKDGFRIVNISPMKCYVIYNEMTGEAVMSVQELRDSKKNIYYKCCTKNTAYTVKDSKIVSEEPHIFGVVPILECPLNYSRISAIEVVITLFDAINQMASNRLDAIEQFTQAFIKFVNCEIDKETFEEMKANGAFMVKSTGDAKGDVEIMSEELDQQQAQIAKDDYLQAAWDISAMPNKEGNTGGDTAGAVELRNGHVFARERAKLKDHFVVESQKGLYELILTVVNAGKSADERLDITTNDFDIVISHSPTDNMQLKAQTLKILLDCGIHPLAAIKACGLWSDAENIFLVSKPYLDFVWKTASENGIDLDTETKRAESFIKYKESGLSTEEAAKLVGLEKSLNGFDESRWSVDDDVSMVIE